MPKHQDRDAIDQANDDHYGLVAGLLIATLVAVMLLAKFCGWA